MVRSRLHYSDLFHRNAKGSFKILLLGGVMGKKRNSGGQREQKTSAKHVHHVHEPPGSHRGERGIGGSILKTNFA